MGWIEKTEEIGEMIVKPESVRARTKKTSAALLTAVRFPLYSFVFFPIFLGASVGACASGGFNWPGFVLAALVGLLAHSAVSFSNEVADEAIDCVNQNRTMFNGGTGLLAKNRITKNTLNAGWIVSALLALLAPAAMVFLFHYHWLLLWSLGLALFLGVEYSFPPLRLSRIGLGEAAAFIAYGVPFLTVGFVTQDAAGAVIGNVVRDFRFYLLALPVSSSVAVTLCLTQIPDTDADRLNGKRSISVLLGPKNVLFFSVFLLLISVASFAGLVPLHILPLSYASAACILPVLTVLVITTNLDAYKIPAGKKMINIMGLSFTSAVFSALVPTIYFLADAGKKALFG
jgi:1,4-dihydroxy-2-naphthoate octaprenyltransferase